MERNDMAVGALIGTGAAITVECGFAPRRVEVLNLTKLSQTTWIYGMTSSWDEGFHAIDTGAGAVDFSALTANGISAYAGSPVNTTLTGTIAITASTAAVTGTSTEFLSQLRVGDEVLVLGDIYSVIAIASDTACTLDRAIGTTAVSGGAVVRVTGRQAGFTIGTTAGVNSDNDVISYTAWR